MYFVTATTRADLDALPEGAKHYARRHQLAVFATQAAAEEHLKSFGDMSGWLNLRVDHQPSHDNGEDLP